MPRKSNATAVTIGIDPGKNTLHLIGLDARGAIVLRERVSRDRIVARLANVPPCLIGIEAGMGTHYVTRELLALGHDVTENLQGSSLDAEFQEWGGDSKFDKTSCHRSQRPGSA